MGSACLNSLNSSNYGHILTSQSSPIPIIDENIHYISVHGLVQNPLNLTVADLQDFNQHSMICALQCAGNRRHTMRTLVKEVQGIDWFDTAVMNCKWRGPRLRDVLSKAGINMEKANWSQAHVEFGCHQNPSQDEQWYGSSISLETAMAWDAEVIIALEVARIPTSHRPSTCVSNETSLGR